MSNATLRILTALVGVPAVLGLAYLGGWPFAGLVLVAALLAQWELYGLMEQGGLRPYKAPGLVLGACALLAAAWPPALAVSVLGAVLLLAYSPLDRQEAQPLPTLAATFFGAIYPSALFGFVLALRQARGPAVDDFGGFALTLALLLLIWTTDTFAYFVGKSLGRHPLFPAVSPKKTWEGSIGGAIGALLVAVVLKLTVVPFLPWGHLLVVALICGIVSQLGDLAESKMKRSVAAKDSGNLLPGHGGLLDRFDALLLAAPLVYLYLAYVAGFVVPG